MSESKYWEASVEQGIQEHRKSVAAEPDWTDIEASKTWLEERYPLLDDTSFGSPLFRYIKECVKYQLHTPGRTPMFLASMLSFQEMLRHDSENNVILTFDPFQTKLYPGYGFPEQDRAPEPTWSDKDASRTWLEQRYPLGPYSAGSPLYRYMHACRESRHYICSSTAVLGSMLTGGEWVRFCTAYPGSVRPLHLDTSNPNVLYPEYDQRTWPERASPTQTNTLPANRSRKRGNEVLGDEQLASSHHKIMRASPGAGGDESPTSYFPAGTPPIGSSRKSNIGIKEDASQPGSPTKSRQTLSSPGNNGPTTSSPCVEKPLAGPSKKRSIEDVVGAPTTDSSPKRKRTRSTSAHTSTSGDSSTSGGSSIYGLRTPSRRMLTSRGWANSGCRLSSGGSSTSGIGPGLGSGFPVDGETSGSRFVTGDDELRLYRPDDPPTPKFMDSEETPSVVTSSSGSNKLRPYSPDDLPQPIYSPRSHETSTEDRAKGGTPDPPAWSKESSYEPPEPKPPSLREESPYEPPEPDPPFSREESPYEPPEPDPPSLRQEPPSCEPPEPDPASRLRKSPCEPAEPDPASLRQESPCETPEPESQGETGIHGREESDDIGMDSKNPRDQTTEHVLEHGGGRIVQTAISVIIPMQRPQRQAAANQAPSSDEDNANGPLFQRRGKKEQKPGARGRKASNSEPQRKQGKRASTMGRNDRQMKPESQQSAYVGRLRPRVGERKQRKPNK
ncbi:hypothetical protein BDR22DRAFT_389467 [Usnea florida]